MSTTSFCKTITIHWEEKKSDSLTTFHTQGVKGHWGEKKAANILYFTFRKSSKQAI